MPRRAPKDESLDVYSHSGKVSWPFYKCRFCDGLIKGRPNQYEETTAEGRWGTASHCRRCGKEISFVAVRVSQGELND